MGKKKMYVAPSLEVIEMVNEGVIAASGSESTGNGGSQEQGNITPISGVNPNSASSSDLEDMINDLFTVEN